jgi:hypothetical protein
MTGIFDIDNEPVGSIRARFFYLQNKCGLTKENYVS